MALGMPVVALAATEVPRVLDPAAGAVVEDAAGMAVAVELLLADEDRARAAGAAARELAMEKFSLGRFLTDWDELFTRLTRGGPMAGSRQHSRGRAEVPQDEMSVTSVPLDTEDGGQVVIRQENAGPGRQVGGGEFKNVTGGRSPEEADRAQRRLDEEAPVDEQGSQPQ